MIFVENYCRGMPPSAAKSIKRQITRKSLCHSFLDMSIMLFNHNIFVCVCVCVWLYGVILFISYNGVGAYGANQPEKIEIFYTEQRATKTRTTHTVKTERTKWTPKSTAREPPSPRNRRMSSNW